MIRINRIGNKLGLAGAVGVLLAIGMVANQMMTESTVAGANDRADRSLRVAEGALTAHLNLRQVQVAGRTIRLARDAADVEKNVVERRQFATSEVKEIDAALQSAQKPETKERLLKIKTLMSGYSAGVEDLAKVQVALLMGIDKRSAISNEWTKAIEAALASP